MKRNTPVLAEQEYDLIVVGGGIYGVCAAWDATLRGLNVLLLERGDFCGATSANSYKIVHGGVRYLQQADLALVRRSSRERAALLRIAPHLVHPLPFVIPTYGHGMKGPEILRVGLWAYDLLTLDRNRGIDDPQRRIPSGRMISRDELLRHFPDLHRDGLTGGAIVSDAQMYNPPRLALSFLRAAVELGARAANYFEVQSFLRDGNRVRGVEGQDLLSGERLALRGKVVLNAAGPWAAGLLQRGLTGARHGAPAPAFSRDVGLVLDRRWDGPYGLACTAQSKDAEALIDRGGRHLFLLPWRDHTLLGVWHKVHRGAPDAVQVDAQELQGFLDEANAAYPALRLTADDVSTVITGLILFGDAGQQTDRHQFAKRSIVVDHAGAGGPEGLVTVIGVRATTARGTAERVIDIVARKLGRTEIDCVTETMPIFGGLVQSMQALRAEARQAAPPGIADRVIDSLVRNYGSEYTRILDYVARDPDCATMIGASHVLTAEVLHAVREEMALKLEDVVMRRTDLGTARAPGTAELRQCAEIMARELGWGVERTEREVAEVGEFSVHRGSRRAFAAPTPA